MKHTREKHLESIGAPYTKVTAKNSDAVVYLWTRKDEALGAMMFTGKRQKPTFRHIFTSIKSRTAYVTDRLGGYAGDYQRNEERRARMKQRNLKVGDILDAQWGYDQTNVDFYQVTGLIGSTMVEVRKIASEETRKDDSMSKWVKPVKDQFIGEPLRRKCLDDAVNVDDVRRASKWSGRELNATSYH